MRKFYGESGAVMFIASNKSFCDEIAKRLEIDGGGDDAGEVVKFAFEEWAKEMVGKSSSRRLEFLERLFK